jgi:ABC-type amino acid transport substrate-binding protein
MRKGETELLAAINEALAKLKESGKYQVIHDKWFVTTGN